MLINLEKQVFIQRFRIVTGLKPIIILFKMIFKFSSNFITESFVIKKIYRLTIQISAEKIHKLPLKVVKV
jgi:hypothetical protein